LLVAVLFAASLMSAFGGGGSNIAHFAHLGGIITGFLYLKSGWRPGEVKRPKRGGVRVKRMAIVHREEKAGEAGSETDQAERWTVQDEAILDEVDRILDKISAEGMSSLTSKERATLDHVSRRHKSN
jgi:hypothetical protein